MSVNKLTNAQRTALSTVRANAFNSGVSRGTLVRSIAASLGARPSMTLYNAGKLTLQIGLMAAALVNKGDNRDAKALFAHCEERITLYQGHGGTGKLRKGMKGRRSKDEEEAYASARVQISQLMKLAGVKVPEKRGGDTSKTRNAKKGANAKRNDAKADPVTRPVSRTFRTADAFIEYLHIQAKALQGSLNKTQPKVNDPRLSEAAEAIRLFATKVTNIH